jgi:hypothetical protein
MYAASAESEPGAEPVGEAMDRSIPFRRGAGEELEHVLHLRPDLECHLHAGPAREVRELAALGTLAFGVGP